VTCDGKVMTHNGKATTARQQGNDAKTTIARHESMSNKVQE